MPDVTRKILWSVLTAGTALATFSAVPARADDPSADLMARGEYIATAGDCVACHTAPGGKPFAGGLKITTPMGDVVTTNITPDPDHGIGKYTEEDFEKSLRHGIRRDGSRLYPAMPYVSYAGMTDDDVKALYTWFMHGVKPVAETPPVTSLNFPANLRITMGLWNMVATSEPPETGDSATFDKLRRGKYLARALEHCGTCHTPRNIMLSEKEDSYLAGASLLGWYAPNITSSKTGGIGNWSEDNLVEYLKTGHVAGLSQAAGPMGEAVEHSTSHLTNDDLHALAAYILQVPAKDDEAERSPREQFGKPLEEADVRSGELTRIDKLDPMDGAHIYDANCAACHGSNGAGTADHYAPSLFHNSVVGSARPDDLIMAVLNGVDRNAGGVHVHMPAFNQSSDVERLSNAEIASVVNYVTATFGSGDHGVTAEQVEKMGKELPKTP
ncbi:c-type cytochrome [Komagataeibacter sucrofermentans]|uniref:Sorbitol dehydrogenase n=1 Tax=Komagataeibacter sucrofermentans TaxID=1053551 RepID=A0A318QME6_9PROT|nr:cytochrome c [Komagataeibacter sucrofermentans]PYD80666.1 sorbitol dehydrogenase [Komagataeibacter sucrofermentans]GBQ50521.1 sorbitol dehydrogenase cytochrome c subunit [Komagataeibacter sucrofermentans DSM 15973]